MKYMLLEKAIGELSWAINRYLSEGWELYGNPFYTSDRWAAQAMVKKTSTEKPCI
jgi:hypothetical protein